jgi:hypothetical protein
MSNELQCGVHGQARAAYVCQHLLATLEDGVSRGAFWCRDEDGCINGYCAECSTRLDTVGGEWTEDVTAQLGVKIKMTCENCFRRIAVINGFRELD